MGTGAFRRRGRLAGYGAIAALAAAAGAGCGAVSSRTAAGAAASSGATAAGSAAGAAGAVQLAAKTASSANSVSGTMSVQATVKPGSTAGGSLNLSGTFSERVRPSVLALVDISSLQSAGSSVPGGLSEILTPSTLYLKAPALTQQLHLSKPWLSIALAQLSQGTGTDLSQLLNSVTANGPLAQTQLLAGTTSARKTGTASLDGVPVTEYTGTIDLAAAAATLSGSSRSQLQQSIKTAGLSTATFTVWIDGQHVTRKAVVHETGKTITETVTTTITGINQPVSIAVPAAGQVTVLPSGRTTGTG